MFELTRYTPASLTPWFDFDRLFETRWPSLRGETRMWSPPVDIYQDENKIVFKAELPDMEEKDLDVRVEDHMLTLKGERKFEKETKEENYRRVESHHGAFMRSFSLADNVNEEKISASYKKGVLEVTVPKQETKKEKARVINVR